MTTVREALAPMARPARLVLGTLWAAGFLVFGLVMWAAPVDVGALAGAVSPALIRTLAILAVAGAEFIFMVLVADEVCPRAPLTMKIALKLTAGSVTWLALCGTLWQIFAVLNV